MYKCIRTDWTSQRYYFAYWVCLEDLESLYKLLQRPEEILVLNIYRLYVLLEWYFIAVVVWELLTAH